MVDIPKEYRPLPETAPKFKELPRNPVNPSIPSKWETRQLKGSRSADGFGFRHKRFTDDTTDIPGPGFYFEEKNDIIRKSASLSKKGLGNAFVSKSTRLASVIRNDLNVGPGQYCPKDINEVFVPTERGKFSTSDEAIGRVPYEDPRRHGPRPGPGEYEVDVNFVPGYIRKKESSTFASQSSRDSFLLSTINVETPSATLYNPNPASTLPERKIMWSKSQYKRFQDLGVDNKVPGPGRYFDELESQRIEEDKMAHNKRTIGKRPPKLLGKQNERPKFAIHTFGADVHRFKHSFLGNLDAAAESPGPGWYTQLEIKAVKKENPNEEEADRLKATGVFKMTGPKCADIKKPMEHRPPGPAYYHPDKPKPKQFFVNTDNKWV